MSLGYNCRFQSSQCNIREIHGVSSEYLNLFFCPAIFSFVQFDLMMTYSIFATRETIFFRFVYIYSAAAVATADI